MNRLQHYAMMRLYSDGVRRCDICSRLFDLESDCNDERGGHSHEMYECHHCYTERYEEAERHYGWMGAVARQLTRDVREAEAEGDYANARAMTEAYGLVYGEHL